VRPGRFTPEDMASGTNWIGDWVGPRAGLDAVAKRKIPCPFRESKPDRPDLTRHSVIEMSGFIPGPTGAINDYAIQ